MRGVSGGTALTAHTALTLAQRAVLADQQIEVGAFLGGELEEDPFAFRILEPLAVALEEPVRAALTAYPNEQRLRVVDPGAAVRHLGKESVRRTLKKRKAGRA